MEHRFDTLAKIFADAGSRRDILKRFGGATAAMCLAALGVSCDDAPVAPSSSRTEFARGTHGLRLNGEACVVSRQCCTGFCDPSTKTCGCQAPRVVCGPCGCFDCGPGFVPVPDITGTSCQCVPA